MIDANRADAFRAASSGSVFFKYMTRAIARIVLQNRTLRISTPGALNDPYDMQFDLHMDINRETLRLLTLRKAWDAFYGDQAAPAGNELGAHIRMHRSVFPRLTLEEFNKEFGEAFDESLEVMECSMPQFREETRALMAQCKILCLTESADSAPMWAHYAEKHRGVVMRFRSVPGLDSPWRVARKVDYVTDMPRLLDDEFLSDMLSGRVSMDVQSIMSRLIYTKSADWAYEREWRMFAGTGGNPRAAYEDLPFNPIELDAVIVGMHMPASDRVIFSELTRLLYPHAEILQVQRAEREFRLEIRPLDPQP